MLLQQQQLLCCAGDVDDGVSSQMSRTTINTTTCHSVLLLAINTLLLCNLPAATGGYKKIMCYYYYYCLLRTLCTLHSCTASGCILACSIESMHPHVLLFFCLFFSPGKIFPPTTNVGGPVNPRGEQTGTPETSNKYILEDSRLFQFLLRLFQPCEKFSSELLDSK